MRNNAVATLAFLTLLAAGRGGTAWGADEHGPPLPGTKLLTMKGDIASELVAGVDRFLQKQIDASESERPGHWHRDFSSEKAHEASIAPNRARLAHILGVRDARVPFDRLERFDGYRGPATFARSEHYEVRAVRWPAFGDVTGEGLEARPVQPNQPPAAHVIVVPDADETPEQLLGLAPGLPVESQVARRLAESGCHVIVPVLIDRAVAPRNGRARLTNREYIYRPAFELGRHIIGYEVQKVLALVDWMSGANGHNRPIGVFGHGEGGAIAFYAAALDRRIAAACVSGYFDDRSDIWRQPVDRNVFGLLEQFGDAEIASLIAPRALIVEAAKGPEFVVPPETGGAPGRLTTPKLETVRAEVERARKLVAELKPTSIALVVSGPDGAGPFGTEAALAKWLEALAPDAPLATLEDVQRPLKNVKVGDIKARQARQIHELDRHNQRLLAKSPYVRDQFMSKLDTKSLQAYEKSIAPYREHFAEEVIGRFPLKRLPPNVRSRRIYETPKFEGFEVVMDVFPDVIAHGILLLPRGIKAGEKRPVVVCQHGLEGRPADVADPNVDNRSYHRFAARLADEGFIAFAPQNLYIFHDRFRVLQRMANPLGKTLFSVIVPQHQQITDWLASLSQVDPSRIAFYGLSYGGKSAMRIPPLVPNYCLSICSGDFNEWVWKNASNLSPYSYLWTGEYEMFEFGLGETFNYAEMAALIAPRPFMVERGHFDGVAPDEMVAHEFARARHLYEARLNLGDRCRIEFFNGPHTIHGRGTFQFLREKLQWPEKAN